MPYVASVDYYALRNVLQGMTPMTVVHELDFERAEIALSAGKPRRGAPAPRSSTGGPPKPVVEGLPSLERMIHGDDIAALFRPSD